MEVVLPSKKEDFDFEAAVNAIAKVFHRSVADAVLRAHDVPLGFPDDLDASVDDEENERLLLKQVGTAREDHGFSSADFLAAHS